MILSHSHLSASLSGSRNETQPQQRPARRRRVLPRQVRSIIGVGLLWTKSWGTESCGCWSFMILFPMILSHSLLSASLSGSHNETSRSTPQPQAPRPAQTSAVDYRRRLLWTKSWGTESCGCWSFMILFPMILSHSHLSASLSGSHNETQPQQRPAAKDSRVLPRQVRSIIGVALL